MKAKSLLVGFIVGTVTAGVATLLTAPTAGKKVRENLAEQTTKWTDHLHDLKKDILELRDAITTAAKEGKKEGVAFLQDAKTLIHSWQDDIQSNQTHLQDEFEAIQKTLAELEANIQQIHPQPKS